MAYRAGQSQQAGLRTERATFNYNAPMSRQRVWERASVCVRARVRMYEWTRRHACMHACMRVCVCMYLCMSLYVSKHVRRNERM